MSIYGKQVPVLASFLIFTAHIQATRYIFSTYFSSLKVLTLTMSAHTKLHNKGDFDKAIATQGKYVLIHAYSGSIFDKAEEWVEMARPC